MHQIIYTIILFFLFSSNESHRPAIENNQGQYFYVKKVVDGDTFWIDDGKGKNVKIRLIGIDAPEPRNAFRKRQQYFGKEASVYLEKLIGNKGIRLEYDVGKLDRYGRALAYAYMENGMFVNAHLVEMGYATVMTVPPNVKYAQLFLKKQQKARRQGRGVWAGR